MKLPPNPMTVSIPNKIANSITYPFFYFPPTKLLRKFLKRGTDSGF